MAGTAARRRHKLSMASSVLLALLVALTGCPRSAQPDGGLAADPAPVSYPLNAQDYPWPKQEEAFAPVVRRFSLPAGFQRMQAGEGSWAQWLQHLPLRQPGTPVRSLQGDIILGGHAPALGAVVDMDVRKNQECADVILRLRAEYLRWAGRDDEIVFHLTGAGKISWPEWKRGMRPRLEGNDLRFYKTAGRDSSQASFDKYLAAVFAWCGTISLGKEGKALSGGEAQIGDFFVRGGSPGHTVLIVDVARDSAGRRKGLLLQGYIPAQSAHVLRASDSSAWFELRPGQQVDVPLWGIFEWSDLRRFE